MDLFQAMKVFVAVVDRGNMTAAGEQCDLSATMVGNHLRALEQHLGASLLRRTTRRQSLTEFGALYYQRCLDILGLVGDAAKLAEHSQATPRGSLRITAPPTFGSECLVPALADYRARFPEVMLDIVLTDRLVDLVEEGFDAAFRLGTLEGSRLLARQLDDYRLVLCAAPAYLRRRGAPTRPADLTTHDCVSFAYPAGTEWRWSERQWRLRDASGDIVVPIRPTLMVNHAQALRHAALSGIGIAILPAVLIDEDLQQGRLLPLLVDYALPVRPLHLLYLQDRFRAPKLRSFVEFAAKRFGKGQPSQPALVQADVATPHG